MKIIVKKDYDQMSYEAYQIVKKQIEDKPDSVICFPTGSTPQGMYAHLREDDSIDFTKVTILSVDEYYGVSVDNPNSYAYQLYRDLFNHVNIPSERILLVDGLQEDVDKLKKRNDELIEEYPIDLYIDGLGENGHIAFNEPADTLVFKTHLSRIAESTREANSRFFGSLDEVPEYAVTLGIAQILSAKHIMVLANGERKKEAINRIINGKELDPQFPASILHLHENVSLIIDELAYK